MRKLLGYFVWKITILRQKIIIFPILGGVRPGCTPPGSAPDKHRGNSFKLQNYKMRLKQIRLNWMNFMQVKKILFTNVFFSWLLCLLNMFHRWYSPNICIFPVCWHNRHHSTWPFLECRPSKLYFKILWKYDDWSFKFHHFLENGRFYRENTCKCSPLVTKWQIILHFHCCFNNKYTPYFLG